MKLVRTEPTILKALVDYLNDGYQITTSSTPQTWRPLRASLAGVCSRRLWYRTQDRADVMELEDIKEPSATINFAFGTFMHDAIQSMLAAGGAQIEVPFSLANGRVTGHVDAVADNGAIEIKTMGGTGHKSLFGLNSWENEPRLPTPRYLLQAALATYALGLDHVRLVLVSKEAISLTYAQRYNIDDIARWGTEWVCDDIDYLEELGQWELKRMLEASPRAIMPHPDTGELIEIHDPRTGEHTLGSSGVTNPRLWVCQYCPIQDICQAEWHERN